MELPRFKVGDRVRFTADSPPKMLTGVIWVCDRCGGGICYRIEPSYDIFIEEINTLYKHVADRLVSKC